MNFLEEIGADFGADQNAYTSFDETVYELFVPCNCDGPRGEDRPALDKALLVLSEFAFRIKATKEDLDLERGTVLEEWRQSRTSQSRVVEAHWKAIMKGSKYENRLPIGIEEVIKGASAATVQEFRDKWYTPDRMGVILVGDFSETMDEMEKKIFDTFGEGKPESASQRVPSFETRQHQRPQFLCQTDEEATQSSVHVSFIKPWKQLGTTWDLNEFREMVVGDMFETALNARLFRRSHSKESMQPFFTASYSNDRVCRNADCVTLTANCKLGGTLVAAESLLVELARIRAHGFTKQEVEAARKELLLDAETAYVERTKRKSDDLRDEYVGAFLMGEAVTDPITEARISQLLLGNITGDDLLAVANEYKKDKGMVIQTVEPPHAQSLKETDEIRSVVEKVVAMEAAGDIARHPDDEQRMSPEDLLKDADLDYDLEFKHDIRVYSELDAKDAILSNGMRVCWKRSRLRDDQVLIQAFAKGGLSQSIKGIEGEPSPTEMKRLRTAKVGALFASDIGAFGIKPPLLSEALAGLRCGVGSNVRSYSRQLEGEQSSGDFVTALKLIHLLFRTEVEAIDSELTTVKQMVREAIQHQLRDPMTRFARRVKFINYGKSFYFRPWTLEEFDQVDAKEATRFWNEQFVHPGQFTLVIVGDIDEIEGAKTDEGFLRLLEKYVGSIQVKDPEKNQPLDAYKDIIPIPFTQPTAIVEEVITSKMVDPISVTQVTFPLSIKTQPVECAQEELFWLHFACQLLEMKLMREMRFSRGEIYSVGVSPSFSVESSAAIPSGKARGDVAISFSCEPGCGARLTRLVLDVIKSLRTDPVSQQEIDSLLEMDKRAYELALDENTFWIDVIEMAYQSRKYRQTKSLDTAYLFRKNMKEDVVAKITPETMAKAFRDIFSAGEKQVYTAVTLEPERPSLISACLSSLYCSLPAKSPPTTQQLFLMGAFAAAAVGVSVAYLSLSRKS